MSNTVVRTNVLALNSHRNLGMVGRQQANASARLSSGYRINSAADDAAGLGISEKMRSQIRGLDQASRNAQDGISLIQTAEGAMSTVNEMVTRIRELVVQASNDTNAHDPNNKAQSDRIRIQDEINQLMDEIDKTRDRTQFNTRNLIDGSLGSGSVGGSSSSKAIDPMAAMTGITDGTELLELWASSFGSSPNIMDSGDITTLVNALTINAGYAWAGGNEDAAKRALIGQFRDAFAAAIGYTGGWTNVDEVELNGAVAVWISKVDPAAYSASSTAVMSGSDVQASAAIKAELLNIWQSMDFSKSIIDTTPPDRLFKADGSEIKLEGNQLTIDSIALGDRNAAQDALTRAMAEWLTKNQTRFGMSAPTVQEFEAYLQAGTAAGGGGTLASGTTPTDMDLEQFLLAGGATADFTLTEEGQKLRNEMEAMLNKALKPFIKGGSGGGSGDGNGLYFQVGANERQGVRLNIEDVGTAALSAIGFMGDKKIENGFSFADLRTSSEQDGAVTGDGVLHTDGEKISQFIVAIDQALAHVTGERSNLGAMQNRLEYTIQNLDVSSENLSAANSRIRDADMAKEMMRLTQANVLQQAATAMLAQANQAPQNVLQLLG